MKKLLLVLALAFSFVSYGQVNTPAPSPFSKVEQKVGLTDVTLEYSRPAMRGRTIFGDLVPYGKIWRTGANARTKITFSNDVTVGGNTLSAGTYAIFTIPQEKSWDIIFYKDSNGSGAPRELDKSKVAAMVNAPVMEMPMDVQSFTITFDDLTNNSAMIGMLWAKTYVGVEFKVPTDKMVEASIKDALDGPGFGDYYASAVYYLNEGKDINKAKEWMDKAMSMTDTPRFWHLRQQSLIYAKAGDKDGAIKAAKQSLAQAEKAGNADYVKMNKDSLKEWGAM